MSSPVEIDMRPRGEVNPQPTADSSAGKTLLYNNSSLRNLLDTKMSRRKLGKAALTGAVAVAIPADLAAAAGDTQDMTVVNAEVASEKDIPFALPVDTKKRDRRVRYMNRTNKAISNKLIEEPVDLPVVGLEFNPKFTSEEAQNRLDMAVINALAHAKAVEEGYLDGDGLEKGYDRLINDLYVPRKDFPTPDWDTYLKRLEEARNGGEPFELSLMALPKNAEVAIENAKWTKADLPKGINFRFVRDINQITSFQAYKSGKSIGGCSFRVDEGQLSIDIYWDNSQMHEAWPGDAKSMYNYTYSAAVDRSLSVLVSALGIVNPDEPLKKRLYEGHLPFAYQNAILFGKFNPEQYELLTGGSFDESTNSFPDAILNVKFAA